MALIPFTHLLTFELGVICGIVLMGFLMMNKRRKPDDPHRHAAAERLGVHPGDLRDTPDGYVPIEGARPQATWPYRTAAGIPVGWTCGLCGHINFTFRRICYGCGGLRLGPAPPPAPRSSTLALPSEAGRCDA